MSGSEERLGQLPDDAGAAQPRERVVALQWRDDRARRKLLGGPMMVGDDDFEAERTRVLDLGNGGDAAVDRDDELEALAGEPRQRVGIQAVALLEPRRQMPRDIGTQFAQQQHRERGRADPVGVIVPVDADAGACGDGRVDHLDGLAHVSERERVVPRECPSEETPRVLRLAVAPPDEHGSGHLVDVERLCERAHGGMCARCELPGSTSHRASSVRPPSDGAVRISSLKCLN